MTDKYKYIWEDTKAEIEFLSKQLTEYQRKISWCITDRDNALAECQAREAKLREAIVEIHEFLTRVTHWQEGIYDLHGAKLDAKNALAIQSNDSALIEYGKQKQREALLSAANYFLYMAEHPWGKRSLDSIEDELRRMAEEIK